MSNGPGTSSGYDPIVGVQPDNPTDVMTFSMLKRPKGRRKIGAPNRRPRVPFSIEITNYRFRYWNGTKWAKYAKTKKEMPFIVGKGVRKSGGLIAGSRQFVIPLEPNEKYSGKFPACIEVSFRRHLALSLQRTP